MLRAAMQLALVPLLLIPAASQLLQDKSIYGKFEQAVVPLDAKEQAQILAKCFWGLGLTTCVADYQDDDIILQRNHPFYNEINDNYGSAYCLTCCGEHEERKDIWDLSCDLDISTAATSNLYGYELRLAAMQYDGDQSIVTCPLKRTACTYEDDGVTLIGCAVDDTYLVGYTLTLEVQEFDKNFNFWTGIKSCSLVAEESDTALGSGDLFRETIIMKYPWDIMNTLDFVKPLIALLVVVTLSYIILYTFRRKTCCYCQGKLVWSQDMCIRCKFVGAEPIDPVLLAALEDKGLYGQGEMPEQFPGSKKAVAYIRKRYGEASRLWNARKLRQEKLLKEAEVAEKFAKLEQEKEELRRAQEEADKQDGIFGLGSDEEGHKNEGEQEEDDVARLRRQFDLGLGSGVVVGLEEVERGEEAYEETYAADVEKGKDERTEVKESSAGSVDDEAEVDVGASRNDNAGKRVSFQDPAHQGVNPALTAPGDTSGRIDSTRLDTVPSSSGDLKKPTPVTAPYKKPWKYPKWMKYFGFRNKPKEVVPVVNPNLLPYPKHIIYAAVGHHKPPPPDEEMEAERRAVFMEALGYVPGEEVDEEGNVIVHHSDEEKDNGVSPYGPKVLKGDKYMVNGVPFWQAELKAAREAVRKAPVEPDWWSEYGLDDMLGIENPFRGWSRPKNASQLRRAYKKKRNYLCWDNGTFPKFRQAAPFMMVALCIVLFLVLSFVLLFAGLDMSRW